MTQPWRTANRRSAQGNKPRNSAPRIDLRGSDGASFALRAFDLLASPICITTNKTGHPPPCYRKRVTGYPPCLRPVRIAPHHVRPPIQGIDNRRFLGARDEREFPHICVTTSRVGNHDAHHLATLHRCNRSSGFALRVSASSTVATSKRAREIRERERERERRNTVHIPKDKGAPATNNCGGTYAS